jgi:hypothetical protein
LHHVVDLFLRGLRAGIALAAVELAQAGESLDRILLAGGRHAPGADRGADQGALARRAREPLAEHPLVERAEDQSLGAAGGGGNDRDVAGAQAMRADLGQGQRPGVEA